MSNTYNGWVNYETWRANLEMFDGFDPREHWDIDNAYELGQELKAWAEELIDASSFAGLARDYAYAFLSDVNWREIAQHMIDDYQTEQDEEEGEEA